MMMPYPRLLDQQTMTHSQGKYSQMILQRIGGLMLTLLALLFISTTVRADCSFATGSSSSVSFAVASPITIPFALATGANLGTAAGPSAPVNAPSLTCTANVPYGVVNLIGSITPTGGTNYVYPTNVPGVGYQLIHATGGTTVPAGPMIPYPSGDSGAATTSSYSVATSLQLVQTGPIANGATLPTGTRLANWQWGSTVPEYFVLSNAVTFTASACQVTVNPIAVTLPTVSTRAFAAGATSTAGSTPFSIQLNCPSGSTTPLSINFSGVRVSGTYANVLKNNNTGGGAATNVGVQMLDQSGSPIAFNNNAPNNTTANVISIGSGISGAVTVPFEAQYFATGTVTVGSVAASATFNLIYK